MIAYPLPQIKGRHSDHYKLSFILDSLGSCINITLSPWCDELVTSLSAHYNRGLNCIYFNTEEDLAFFKLSIPPD